MAKIKALFLDILIVPGGSCTTELETKTTCCAMMSMVTRKRVM